MNMVDRTFRGSSLVVLASLLLISSASTLGAQPKAPAWVRLNIIDVRGDMVDEFLAIQEQFSADAKKAGRPFRSVWQTAQIGPTWRFAIATPMKSIADLGAPSTSDDSVIDRAVKCIVSRRSLIVRPMNDLSKPLPAGTTPSLAVVTMTEVAPGREDDYISWLKNDYIPHFDKVGVHYLSGDVGLGGGNSFVQFALFESFDEIAKGSPLMRSAGPEGAAAVRAKRAGIVTGGETMIMRYDKERSFDQRGSN